MYLQCWCFKLNLEHSHNVKYFTIEKLNFESFIYLYKLIEEKHLYWINFTDFLSEVINVTDIKAFSKFFCEWSLSIHEELFTFRSCTGNCKRAQLKKSILIMTLIHSLLNTQIHVCTQRDLSVYMMISVFGPANFEMSWNLKLLVA